VGVRGSLYNTGSGRSRLTRRVRRLLAAGSHHIIRVWDVVDIGEAKAERQVR
jgi:hypothetical protein